MASRYHRLLLTLVTTFLAASATQATEVALMGTSPLPIVKNRVLLGSLNLRRAIMHSSSHSHRRKRNIGSLGVVPRSRCNVFDVDKSGKVAAFASDTKKRKISAPSKKDKDMVRTQLGRPPMGKWSVQAYCSSGHPQVLRVHPIAFRKGKATPFPTLFWLTCPHYRQWISRLEANGSIAKINNMLSENKDMATLFEKQQEEYRKMRYEALDEEDLKFLEERPTMKERLMAGGIGGSSSKNRIRCLHENYAHFLATGSNVVGVRPILNSNYSYLRHVSQKFSCHTFSLRKRFRVGV
mmetsp:Transcript_6311/g.8786  ORF Transcript_6311/g.8786 Transcript_6311/m.8786 type:complete len:295 (-) Transcript_6311:456-1340(-)